MNRVLKLKWILITAFAVTAGITIPGCSNNGTGPGENEVWIEGSAYDPADMTIAQGTTITWTNKDAVIHSVTSGTPGMPSGMFDSGDLSQDANYSFTFDSIGTYPYYCRHHGGMTAAITVQ